VKLLVSEDRILAIQLNQMSIYPPVQSLVVQNSGAFLNSATWAEEAIHESASLLDALR
jgi:hypothetical protein